MIMNMGYVVRDMSCSPSPNLHCTTKINIVENAITGVSFVAFPYLKTFSPPRISVAINYKAHQSIAHHMLYDSYVVLASSPGPSQLFLTCRKKITRGPGIQSHVTNVGKMASHLSHRQAFDFKPGCHLRSFKRSSMRPLRIILPR